jgi:hypothetical protein
MCLVLVVTIEEVTVLNVVSRVPHVQEKPKNVQVAKEDSPWI